MAAPKAKIVKTLGKWKKVNIDTDAYADENFADLIKFKELKDYDISNFSDGLSSYSKKKSSGTWNVEEQSVENDKNDSKTQQLRPNKLNQKKFKKVNITSEKKIAITDASDSKHDKACGVLKSGRENVTANVNKSIPKKRKKSNHGKVKRRSTTSSSKKDDKTKSEKVDDIDVSTIDMSTWDSLFVPPLVLKALAVKGFTSPMPIQAMALPPAIRDGKDILGAAETGSGKTLAFGIPMLHYILEWKEIQAKKIEAINNDQDEAKYTPKRPLLGLVLTPTRELAVQVKGHIEAAAKFTDIQVAVILGGMSQQKQQRILKRCPEIIIATPGRLWDLIETEEPHLRDLSEVTCLVVDEADRMIEKGHFQELTSILDNINQDTLKASRRHIYVYSATLTTDFTGHIFRKKKRVYRPFVKHDPVDMLMREIGIKPNAKIIDLTNKLVTAQTLVEARIQCDAQEKDLYLYNFITNHPGRTLVFTNSKDCVRRLQSVFTLLACNPRPLHADMHQKQRLKNLEKFTANESVLLLATDVAARGLDIPDVHHVIHYQVPRTVENYVHRSGRTARVQKEGISIMLVSSEDAQCYRKIVLQSRKGEDLSIFPVRMQELNGIRPVVELARDIDRFEHRTSKMKRENDWFIKAANDMDMELDTERTLHNYKEKDENKAKKELKVMKAQLCHMLKQPIRILDYLGKYPMQTGSFSDPRVRENKGTAISQMKNKIAEKDEYLDNLTHGKKRKRKDRYHKRKLAKK